MVASLRMFFIWVDGDAVPGWTRVGHSYSTRLLKTPLLVVLKSWFRCANATAGPPPDRQSQGTALPLLTWLALSPPCFARILNPPRNLGREKKRAVPSQNDATGMQCAGSRLASLRNAGIVFATELLNF